VPAQQNRWIRLRQNLFRQFDDLPGALYQLAIILAGATNLYSGHRSGFFGMGVNRHRLGNAKHLLKFPHLAAKDKAGFLFAAAPLAFR